MPNLWKDGKIVETVDVYRVYKTCPKCGNFYADMWSETFKVKEDIDWTKPIEEHTVTYKTVTKYKCRSCKHGWKK